MTSTQATRQTPRVRCAPATQRPRYCPASSLHRFPYDTAGKPVKPLDPGPCGECGAATYQGGGMAPCSSFCSVNAYVGRRSVLRAQGKRAGLTPCEDTSLL